MAFTQIMEGGRHVAAQKEFVCDEAADLGTILTDYDGVLPIGTIAYVVSSGAKYILGSDSEWVEQPASGGGGGADGTTFTPAVSQAGVISWTNDGNKANPSPVDLVTAVINALPSAVGVSF